MKDQAEELELGADQRIRRKSKISKSNLKPQKVSINIPALNIPNPASPASFPGDGPTGCRYPFRRDRPFGKRHRQFFRVFQFMLLVYYF